MSPVYRMDWRDGWLCVVAVESDWMQPILVSTWWSVRECPRADVAYLIGRKAIGRNGSYGVRLEEFPGGRWEDFNLKDGGERTLAIATDLTPIPPPRVRKGIEIRYRDGRWQKYLQSRGWVAA